MEKGIWKKYEKTERNKGIGRASYDELYDDLRNSGKNWNIANDYSECKDELCGELISYDGTMAGDIYVYYIEKDGRLCPEFYIKVREFRDLWTEEKKNHILYNNNSLGYDGIDNKYLPELILKLREIDEVKNWHYIIELEERYKNYQRLLSLENKKDLTEDDIIFIYKMSYRTTKELLFPMIESRNIQDDYDSLSDEGKVKLFLVVKNDKISNKLSIDSKNILMKLAYNGSLKQLNNASEEVINDKEYIMQLLSCFFEADKKTIRDLELILYLPKRYQSDIDVLEFIFSNYYFRPLSLNEWIRKNSMLRENMKNPEFSYRLVNSFIRRLISNGDTYYKCGFMDLLDYSLLDDIENHILIGPEVSQEKEELKNISIGVLKEERDEVKRYILKHNK